MSITTTTFWRKTYSVDAVRLTSDNIRMVGEAIDAEYCESMVEIDTITDEPIRYLKLNEKLAAYIGHWIVKGEAGEEFLVYDDEDFLDAFRTHSEQLSEDEKYAKVYELVSKAMRKQDSATYHGDSSGMDLVAIETTKKILNEL